MRKKFYKAGKKSVAVIIPPALLDLMGCDLTKLDKTTIDIKFDSNTNRVSIGDPQTIEEML